MKSLVEIATIYAEKQFPNDSEKRMCALRSFMDGYKKAINSLMLVSSTSIFRPLYELSAAYADTYKDNKYPDSYHDIMVHSFEHGFHEAMAILRHIRFFTQFPLEDEDPFNFINPEK